MVREDTAYKLHFLQYGGAFSIKKKTRDMLESLDYAAKLLDASAVTKGYVGYKGKPEKKNFDKSTGGDIRESDD